MSTLNEFIGYARNLITRTPAQPLAVHPHIVVDMGAKEQAEIQTTVDKEFQNLGGLLQQFEQRFRIRVQPNVRLRGSALVNPFDSSIVVADSVRENQSIFTDQHDAANQSKAVAQGLALLLESVRGHAAPRDDIDYSQSGINQIGQSHVALLKSGQLVLSVGPNSLMDLKGDVARLWEVDPLFWAALHGKPSAIENGVNTQYTARYHSPQMVRALFESQLEWLLQNPRELPKLADPAAIPGLQARILQESFFPKLQREFAAKRAVIAQARPKAAEQAPLLREITGQKEAAIPDLPIDIITHHDDYKILGIYVPKQDLQQLPEAGQSVYVAIETRRYVTEDKPGAAASRLERIPVTLAAERTNAVFSGLNGTLTLAPCVHGDAGDVDGRVKLNLFVQMTSAANPTDGFHPSGAAGGLFEHESGGFIAVGHKVYALVAKDLVDPVVAAVNGELENAGVRESSDIAGARKVDANWAITQLVDRGLINYVDTAPLKATLGNANALNELVGELYAEARKPRQVINNPHAVVAKPLAAATA